MQSHEFPFLQSVTDEPFEIVQYTRISQHRTLQLVLSPSSDGSSAQTNLMNTISPEGAEAAGACCGCVVERSVCFLLELGSPKINSGLLEMACSIFKSALRRTLCRDQLRFRQLWGTILMVLIFESRDWLGTWNIQAVSHLSMRPFVLTTWSPVNPATFLQ